MAKSIFWTALLSLCLLGQLCQGTILTYIVERQIDQEDSFVELKLKVQADGRSLKESIDRADEVIKRIKRIVIEDCEKNTQKKSQIKKCKDIVEDPSFEVEPKYHMVRKIPTFTLFILTHEVTISIKNVKGLGKLIDQIVTEGDDLVTLQEFVWKADKEQDPEVKTLKDGLQEGRQLCEKIGQKLEDVISVEELQDEEEEEEEEEVVDEDLTEPETEVVIFKFKVNCGDAKAQNKKGKKK